MSGSVGKLDRSDAAKVIEVSAYLVVRGVGWELCLGDEQVGLGDIGGRQVVAKKKHCYSGLGVGVLAKDCATECGQKLRSSPDDGCLTRRWLWIELLVEEVIVKVGFRCQSVQCPPVEIADFVNQDRRIFRAFREFLLIIEIDLKILETCSYHIIQPQHT